MRTLKLAGFVEHQLPTPLRTEEQKRWLLVEPEIGALLSGNGPAATNFPHLFAFDVLNRFVRGWVWSVSSRRPPRRKKSDADLKKLEGLDEAWVMVFPKPKPGWRLFGRFHSQNVFVGLGCFDRHDCEPDNVYQQRALDMIARWELRLPTTEPLRGQFYETYLSNPTGTTIFNRDEE